MEREDTYLETTGLSMGFKKNFYIFVLGRCWSLCCAIFDEKGLRYGIETRVCTERWYCCAEGSKSCWQLYKQWKGLIRNCQSFWKCTVQPDEGCKEQLRSVCKRKELEMEASGSECFIVIQDECMELIGTWTICFFPVSEFPRTICTLWMQSCGACTFGRVFMTSWTGLLRTWKI